ncbi:hypothetical protein R2F61_03905 [Mollicutes bacterium LVI A0078]|nr:hypothetical protein RZE84_03930 [Mollicutes bacterium LVI A0075]WOO91707.1 hypothetical protein R2F61_03905 [Mollicutes bacterium LVI A0078]
MNKEEYEAIISLDKQNIIDYMKDVKTEAGKIKAAVVEGGEYYQNTNKQGIIETRMENLVTEMDKLIAVIEGEG